MLVSLKEYVTRECLLFLEPYFTENLPGKKKNVPWFLLYAWAKGDFFFFFKDLQSRQSHSKQRAGVIFYCDWHWARAEIRTFSISQKLLWNLQ